MERPLTRRERVFLAVGGVVAAALCVLLTIMSRHAPSDVPTRDAPAVPVLTDADQPLTDYVEGLRKAGEPTTLREAAARDAPRDDASAAWLKIRRATLLLDAELTSDFAGDPKFWPWDGADSPESETPENLARLAALAPRMEGTCDAIAAALESPRCRFPFEEADAPENVAKWAAPLMNRVREIDEGKQDPLIARPLPPGAREFRNLNVRLTAERALAGQAVGAEQDTRRLAACRTLLAFGRKDEPISLLDLSGDTSLVVSGVTALRYGVEGRTLDPSAARATLDGLLSRSALDLMPAALLGERAHTIDMYRAVMTLDMKDHERRAVAQNIVQGCEALTAVTAVRTSPLANWLLEVERVSANGGSVAKVLPPVAKKLARCDAATRLARVALAVAEHRTKNGEFPTKLEDVKWAFRDAVPLDPFTDAPFVYARTDAGVRIASVGGLSGDPAIDEETLRERCLVWELRQ